MGSSGSEVEGEVITDNHKQGCRRPRPMTRPGKRTDFSQQRRRMNAGTKPSGRHNSRR